MLKFNQTDYLKDKKLHPKWSRKKKTQWKIKKTKKSSSMFIKLSWNFFHLSSSALRCRSLSFKDWWKHMSCRLSGPTLTSFWVCSSSTSRSSSRTTGTSLVGPLRVLPGSLRDLDPDRLPHVLRPERGAPRWVILFAFLSSSPPLHPQTAAAHLLVSSTAGSQACWRTSVTLSGAGSVHSTETHGHRWQAEQ